MTGLPGMPPPPPNPTNAPGGAVKPAARGLRPISGGVGAPKRPAAPPPGPPREVEPPQMPFLHSLNDEVVDFSEEQFRHDLMQESQMVPAAVLVIGIIAAFGIGGFLGASAVDPMSGETMGMVGALGMWLLMGPMLILGALVAVLAGWITCKLFSEDYGSVPALLLRFSAVASAQTAVFGLLMALLGPFVSLVIGIPVMFVVTMLVAGFDFLRTLVFNVISNLIFWGIVAFLMMGLASSI